MGRPATREKKLKDGFYIEVRNKGAKTGVKVRRDTEEEMKDISESYSKNKEVIVLGESINGKWAKDIREKERKAATRAKKKAEAAERAAAKKAAAAEKKKLAAAKKAEIAAEKAAKKKAAAAAKKKAAKK